MKLDPEAALLSGLDEPQVARLRCFEGLLRERAVPFGMVSRTDAPRLWERHVLDSLRAKACLGPRSRSLADLGSGAGLPGIPLAIALPEAQMTLVEPRARRAAFLEMAVGELGLTNVAVEPRRAEQARLLVDVCLARALAVPAEAWQLGKPLLKPGGRLVYFAGASFDPAISGAALPDSAVHICRAALFPGYGSLVIIQGVPRTPPS